MITEDDVMAYRRVHFPESVERERVFVERGGYAFPFKAYVRLSDHAGFHCWFGRACDATCPHLPFDRAKDAAPLPVARAVRIGDRLRRWLALAGIRERLTALRRQT